MSKVEIGAPFNFVLTTIALLAIAGVVGAILFGVWYACVGTGAEYAGYAKFSGISGLVLWMGIGWLVSE